MRHETDEFLTEEAQDFLVWLEELGIGVWKDMTTMELVFTPKSRMTRDMIAEAVRLRSYLAPLIGPGVQVTLNPYNASRN